ncbi:MAG TPA: HipA domain-containing protein [Acidimicrobiales bacterium]|nr:HipA domain-containing protein [Acidimicrobiales bacterium]
MTEADVRGIERADVYKGDELAGTLERTGSTTAFRYVSGYRGRAVAGALPVSGQPVVRQGGAVHPFFAGLLPEGVRLTALRSRIKTSADDMFSLLLAVGGDCIGDVRVVPAGHDPTPPPPLVQGTDWSALDFEALFEASVAVGGEQVERAALPGVQPKVSADMISFPVRTATGAYILKLNPPEYPALVENEAFFLRLAADAGLRVAQAEVVVDGSGRTGLWVRRFDRVVGQSGVSRLEQEDACQFCDEYPSEKYRLSINRVTEQVVELVDAPVVAVRDLIRLVAFSYVIANGDLHAKNISILREGDILGLAPAYDLVADLPYTRDERMALQLDGRDLAFKRRYYVDFAARFRVPAPAVHHLLDRICDVVPAATERLGEIGLDDRRTEHLRRVMLNRREDLGS